eukprot:3845715-Amphidinium_carterae.1
MVALGPAPENGWYMKGQPVPSILPAAQRKLACTVAVGVPATGPEPAAFHIIVEGATDRSHPKTVHPPHMHICHSPNLWQTQETWFNLLAWWQARI